MARMVKWIKDKRGSIAVQALLFIAIFLLIAYLGVEIWKVVSIQRSVRAATYQATKYIALNGPHWGLDPGVWEEAVWPLIVNSLLSNPFVPADSIGRGQSRNPAITIWLDPACNAVNYCERGRFWIQVDLKHRLWIPPRIEDTDGTLLQVNVSGREDGKLQCFP